MLALGAPGVWARVVRACSVTCGVRARACERVRRAPCVARRARLREQNVLELEVAVHDAERMQVLDGQQHLRWPGGGRESEGARGSEGAVSGARRYVRTT